MVDQFDPTDHLGGAETPSTPPITPPSKRQREQQKREKEEEERSRPWEAAAMAKEDGRARMEERERVNMRKNDGWFERYEAYLESLIE